MDRDKDELAKAVTRDLMKELRSDWRAFGWRARHVRDGVYELAGGGPYIWVTKAIVGDRCGCLVAESRTVEAILATRTALDKMRRDELKRRPPDNRPRHRPNALIRSDQVGPLDSTSVADSVVFVSRTLAHDSRVRWGRQALPWVALVAGAVLTIYGVLRWDRARRRRGAGKVSPPAP